MVNVFRILKPMVKLVGISPQKVEIEPGRSSLMAFSRGFFKFWPWPSNPTLTSLISFSSANSATDKSDRSTAFQAERVVKGLKKLGVESCTVVGFSYGGVVAFKMAKLYPGFVDSVVVTGSIVEFTRSKSDKLLNGVGFSLWSDFLSPETVEDLKGLIKVGSHGKLFSSLPHLFYRDILQEMYPFRNERAQVLDELVLPDHYEVPSTAYTQVMYGDEFLRAQYNIVSSFILGLMFHTRQLDFEPDFKAMLVNFPQKIFNYRANFPPKNSPH
ncbi:OLC1v1003220C1 [Oldenlandia corymbosa var. corymbosa]|uniref:OLC1v1003220C1 n=1 Tax=Oldenlandia corymbosa var. corymbosa TaxID=529605 RepID=A0AAV1DBX0_OLDCO|nr:OLC1v1003220C1 [Oldenlandia corymbosa var. corymbosa]